MRNKIAYKYCLKEQQLKGSKGGASFKMYIVVWSVTLSSIKCDEFASSAHYLLLCTGIMNQFLLIGPQTLKYKQNFLKGLENWKDYTIEDILLKKTMKRL